MRIVRRWSRSFSLKEKEEEAFELLRTAFVLGKESGTLASVEIPTRLRTCRYLTLSSETEWKSLTHAEAWFHVKNCFNEIAPIRNIVVHPDLSKATIELLNEDDGIKVFSRLAGKYDISFSKNGEGEESDSEDED
jgi:hypothetical protein